MENSKRNHRDYLSLFSAPDSPYFGGSVLFYVDAVELSRLEKESESNVKDLISFCLEHIEKDARVYGKDLSKETLSKVKEEYEDFIKRIAVYKTESPILRLSIPVLEEIIGDLDKRVQSAPLDGGDGLEEIELDYQELDGSDNHRYAAEAVAALLAKIIFQRLRKFKDTRAEKALKAAKEFLATNKKEDAETMLDYCLYRLEKRPQASINSDYRFIIAVLSEFIQSLQKKSDI